MNGPCNPSTDMPADPGASGTASTTTARTTIKMDFTLIQTCEWRPEMIALPIALWLTVPANVFGHRVAKYE